MTALPIRLRPYTQSDLPAVHDAIVESRAEVVPWLPDLLGALDPDLLARWFTVQASDRQAGHAYHYAIVSAAADTFVGGCGLTNLNQRHRFANLYYWVRTSATRRGVAAAAARALAQLGFAEHGLQRVEIVVDCANAASLRAAEKTGARREGLLRSRLRDGDTPRDAVMFSLVPADFAS